MPRRHPKAGAQQAAPQGFPGDGGRRWRAPLLPRLTPSELRAAPRAQSSRGSRMSAPRAAHDRRAPPSVQLPPLPAARAPPDPDPARRGPGPREDPRWDPAPEGPDFLGALLGELLPGRFRQFLRQLRALSEEPPPTPTSASQHPREAREPLPPAPRSRSRSQHADLLGPSSHLQRDLQKALLHQMTALGPLRGAQPPCSTVKECSQLHSTQAPKLKAVISHSSSGEGSGSHRRYCPFRVRFADETLRDTAIRYWDRYCAGYLSAQHPDVLGPQARDFHRAPAPPVFCTGAELSDYWRPRSAVGQEPGNSFIEQLLPTRLCGQGRQHSSLREPVSW
ncbi:uncharacterized protein C9orf50 homolog [Talpa occidentalis]|uniref:uncharacterized protein C9orf50 homolog n=1 Tax=Talpa occidentalis TaxID=50954 RepID=UPI0018903DBA|nr:uncharacterized protein C9orf50 homolog [Talpa occidentalis]